MMTSSRKVLSPILQLSDLLRPAAFQSREPVDPSETVRQAIDVVRRTYEELQARAIELQKVIRCEERAVAEWRRKVHEAEEQLTRWRPTLADAEARLDQARRQFAELADRTREATTFGRDTANGRDGAVNGREPSVNGRDASLNGYGIDGVAVSPVPTTTDGRRPVDRVA
jgi:septal ring factor EnvC (AmiA/AmiB activator)